MQPRVACTCQTQKMAGYVRSERLRVVYGSRMLMIDRWFFLRNCAQQISAVRSFIMIGVCYFLYD